MTRLRWSLGALLVALSLASAGGALQTYVVHRLWLGGLAVLVLAVIAVAGFASLARARLRLWRELDALSQDPPSGQLYAERRRQVEALHARGTRPDLDVLAQATASVELGHAYLGKYLVAVTVLVGLVGTFAGLMETLRGVAPLLADEQVTTLKALAGPLAGLDVTFGASLVGILVTLALALVQGDLALAEEATLSRLEERTRHVIVPDLWPAADSADERSVRELSALRAELASFLQNAAEAASKQVGRAAQAEVDRLVKSLQASLTGTVEGTASRVEQGLLSLANTVEAKLGPVFTEQRNQLQSLQQSAERAATAAVDAGTQTAEQIQAAGRDALRGMQASTEALQEAQAQLLQGAAAAQDRLTQALQTAGDQVQQTLTALGAQQGEHAAQLLAAQKADQQRMAQAHDALLRQGQSALDALRADQEAQATQRTAELREAAARVERALLDAQKAHVEGSRELQAQQQQAATQLEQSLSRIHREQASQSAELQRTQHVAVESLQQAMVQAREVQTEQAAQLLDQQQAGLSRVEQALLDVQRTHAAQSTQLQNAQASQLVALHEAQAAQLARLYEAHLQRLTDLQAEQAAHVADLRSTQTAQADRLQTAQAEQAAALQRHHSQVATQIEAALVAAQEAQANRLAATTDALCQALQGSIGSEGARLGEAAQALHGSALELARAAQNVSAPLSALTPELQALSREVALMAARSDGESGNATLSELLRLGEGVERLEALLRMSHGIAEHVQPAAAIPPAVRSSAEDKAEGEAA